jgi:hypothetical protein
VDPIIDGLDAAGFEHRCGHVTIMPGRQAVSRYASPSGRSSATSRIVVTACAASSSSWKNRVMTKQVRPRRFSS